LSVLAWWRDVVFFSANAVGELHANREGNAGRSGNDAEVDDKGQRGSLGPAAHVDLASPTRERERTLPVVRPDGNGPEPEVNEKTALGFPGGNKIVKKVRRVLER
jgi:hypothetical protein